MDGGARGPVVAKGEWGLTSHPAAAPAAGPEVVASTIIRSRFGHVGNCSASPINSQLPITADLGDRYTRCMLLEPGGSPCKWFSCFPSIKSDRRQVNCT